MKIRRATLQPFALPLKHPLQTGHERISIRRGYLVEIEAESGLRGYGEATPLPDFGTEDLGDCRAALESTLSDWVLGVDRDRPRVSLPEAAVGGSAPCAQWALDLATLDLSARSSGKSLAVTLGEALELNGSPLASVQSQVLVAGTSPAEVEESARAGLDRGFSTFKLKLALAGSGSSDAFAFDVARVRALREAVGPAARLRLDANEGWSFGEAQSALAALSQFDIDFVEQPVARSDWAGLAELTRGAPIGVATDEALLGEGLAHCLASQAASILIVKPAAIGGLAACRALQAAARASSLRVIWSTLIDGAVSRMGAAALAAAWGFPTEVHGLGTGGLLAADLGEAEDWGPGGELRLPAAHGLGFDPTIPSNSISVEEDAYEVVAS